MTENWDQAPEAGELTLKQLNDLCLKLVEKRNEKKALENQVAEADGEVKSIEAKILEYMKEYGMPSFKGSFGTISVRNNKQVLQPENLAEKQKLFDYLKELDVFFEMVNVNSRTLCSWATKEIEAKEKDGIFGWVPPGLKAPNEYQSLSLRKA
jgi:hypothetical protein